MFVDSAYWHNSRIDFKDRKHPLFVGSCGTYRLMTTTKLPTHRPRGRVDFQLLYVAAGKGHFYFNGKEHIVPAGNMVLYRPREEQRYYYYGADHTEVYWVHFTGSNVTNILRRYGFRDGEHVIHTGTSLEYSHIFRQIIEELRACRPHYEESCIYRLHLLFILLSRLDEKKTRRRSPHMAGQMNTAVNYFHEHYSEPISIGDYAQSLGLSVSWFTRSFREYTGSSPAQYLISLRISAAQSLLETSDHNVSEISELVGYSDKVIINLDFADVSSIMKNAGRAHMGVGTASGREKAEQAAMTAVASPLLETSINGATGVLINVTGSQDLSLDDVETAANIVMEAANPDANIIFGATFSEDFEDEMRVTVIATGFDADKKEEKKPERRSFSNLSSDFGRPAAPAATAPAAPAAPVVPANDGDINDIDAIFSIFKK